MSYDESLKVCKQLRINHEKFRKFNLPARVFALIAIVVPLAISYPTAPYDEKGEVDIGGSPYAMHAGVIFISAVAIAVFFSRKASKFKITTSQRWALNAFQTYENLSEYNREPSLIDYKVKAANEFSSLVDDIQQKINDTDEKIRWMVPFVNPVEKLSVSLKDTLQVIEGGDKKALVDLESYLIKLATYFLNPSNILLNEILVVSPSVTTVSANQVVEARAEKFTLLGRIGVFGTFVVVGIITYNIALTVGIDKNYAFVGGIGIIGTLVAAFIGYLKK